MRHHHPEFSPRDSRGMHCEYSPRHFSFGRGGHHQNHGHSGFPSRGGPGGGGEDFMMRGRQFGSDDLQLLIMALLADGPKHGYELIKMLDTRSKGFYVPSPGMIYPALTYLEELGHATVQAEGNRKSYTLSTTGTAHLEANRERADLLLAKLSYFGKKMEMVREAMSGERSPDGADDHSAMRELLFARRNLKAKLIESSDASAEQQTRIAKVLDQATEQVAAILSGRPS